MRRAVLLAHGKFPDRSKTANGILRYSDREVVAVLDRDRAGERIRDHLPDVQDAPIVADFAAAREIARETRKATGGERETDDERNASDAENDGTTPENRADIDELLIGISPIGGEFDESWRPDVRAAIEAGCTVTAGLHYFLSEDEEFAALADQHDATLTDVRRPPEDSTVASGTAGEVEATVVCTVGTDCAVGKMTTTMELAAAAREAGIDARVIPTGQTGIMIEGWGTPIDRVVSDFAAGAVEEMIHEVGDDHDLLIVEGQGSIVHPAYSAVTCGILHGAAPDALVVCHEAGREAIHGYESFRLPSIPEYVDLYESFSAPVADAPVVAGALDTSDFDGEGARTAVEEFADALDAPASDPIRFGSEPLVDALR